MIWPVCLEDSEGLKNAVDSRKMDINTHSFRIPNYQVFICFLGTNDIRRELILSEAGDQRSALRSQSEKTNKGMEEHLIFIRLIHSNSEPTRGRLVNEYSTEKVFTGASQGTSPIMECRHLHKESGWLCKSFKLISV